MAYESLVALGLVAGIFLFLATVVLSVLRTLAVIKIKKVICSKPLIVPKTPTGKQRNLVEEVGEVPPVELEPTLELEPIAKVEPIVEVEPTVVEPQQPKAGVEIHIPIIKKMGRPKETKEQKAAKKAAIKIKMMEEQLEAAKNEQASV